MGIRNRSYSSDVISSALRGYEAGLSQRKISEALSIPRTTIREWIHDYRKGRMKQVEIEHSHHWLISSPNGPISLGRCKVCFIEREFLNAYESGFNWTRSGSSDGEA